MEIRGLPFPVTVTGDPASGASAELGIDLAPPIAELGFDQLRCVVAWYAALGKLGGLGGADLPPDGTTAVLGNQDEPVSRGPRSIWRFDALCVDPRSLVILANLVFATGLQVTRAWLHTAGHTAPEAYAPDDFPEVYRQAPFEIDDLREHRNVTITISFADDLPVQQHGPVSDMLRIWSMVGALGGFRHPGPLRERLDLLPEDDPEIILDELNFSIRDQGMHDAAYGVLTNLLIRLHRSEAGITRLRMC
ncbi:MAG TPA: hypothetical protein VF092_26570 [Longimicrobium sp.]